MEHINDFVVIRIKYKIINDNRDMSKLEKFIGPLDDEVILGENKFLFYRLIKENEFNGFVDIYSNQINKIGEVKMRFIIIDYKNISDDISDLDSLIKRNLKNVSLNSLSIYIEIFWSKQITILNIGFL